MTLQAGSQFLFCIGGFQFARFDAFKFFSKTLVFTPHDVTDDVEQVVDTLLRQKGGA
jgi:hypothetical protein